MTSDRAELVLAAARVGGKAASSSVRRNIAVGIKNSRTDVVTQTDRNAQREVVAPIRGVFLEDSVNAEESEESRHLPDDCRLAVPTETPPAAARGGNEAGAQ